MGTLGLLLLAMRGRSLAFAQKTSATQRQSIRPRPDRQAIRRGLRIPCVRIISARGLPSVQKPEHYVR